MITREELYDWMGYQDDSTYDNVKVVIDCPSLSHAYSVSDLIEEIIECDHFDPRDGATSWWRYLFLFKREGKNRVINAWSSNYNKENMPKHIEVISAEDFVLAARGVQPVCAIDLL